jgi:hypothetical protein
MRARAAARLGQTGARPAGGSRHLRALLAGRRAWLIVALLAAVNASPLCAVYVTHGGWEIRFAYKGEDCIFRFTRPSAAAR